MSNYEETYRYQSTIIDTSNESKFDLNKLNLVVIVILTMMLFVAITSVVRLGYQLTMIFIKMVMMIVIALIEVSLIYLLLYPFKGVHHLIIGLEYIIKNLILEFLERKRSESTVLKITNILLSIIRSKYYKDNDMKGNKNNTPAVEEADPYRVHIY